MNKYQQKIKTLFDKVESIRLNAEKENRAMTVEEIKARTDIKAEIDSVKVEWDSIEAEFKMKSELFGDGNSNRQIIENPVDGGKQSKKKIYNSLGEQLVDVVRASRNDFTNETRNAQAKLTEVVAASGANEAVTSDGGFLVDTDFSSDLTKGVIETGLLASKCFKLPISAGSNGVKLRLMDETSRANGSRFGGIQVYWDNEAATITESKPKFRIFELNLSKLMGIMYATDELLQDAATLEAAVMQWFPKEFGFELDDAIINGTGAGQPLGILNAGCTVSVAKETGQAASTIQPENIIKMWSRLLSSSKGTSAWYINADVVPQLYLMSHAVGTGGIPVFMPANSMTGQPNNTLMGRSIIEIEQCPTIGTVGDIMLMDLSQYAIIEKGGIQAAASVHVKFIYDEMTFRWTYRVNGKPILASALTPYKGTANTRSPFVTLATRG